jgi:hypothetical protein
VELYIGARNVGTKFEPFDETQVTVDNAQCSVIGRINRMNLRHELYVLN